MKTIAQIAAEIGVSKQAVHKKMKQEPLSTSLRQLTSTRGNAVVVSVDGEKLIKKAFSVNESSTSSTKSTTSLVDEVDEIDNQIDNQLSISLRFQIENLKEQNRDLREQLNLEQQRSKEQWEQLNIERQQSRELAVQLAQLAQNAQQLHMGEMMPRIAGSTENQSEVQEEPKEKVSFIQKIFGKKKLDA